MHDDGALTVVGGRTLPTVLRAGARAHPDRPLLAFEGDGAAVATFSYADILERTLAMAARLAALGVARGDRLHLHLPNRPEFLVSWFAAAELGAIIVPTNTASTAAELAYILEHAAARTSIVDAAGRAVVEQARAAVGADGPLLDCDVDALLELPEPPAVERPAVASGDDLAIMYTSGTTARPKGVRITHANYIYAGEVIRTHLALTGEDRFLTVLPLFHANAQYYSTMGSLMAGGTIVLAHRFSASGYAELAVRHGATVGSLFAAPIRMILAKAPRPHWREHRLRVVVFAQNLTADELARWDEVIGAPLLQMYGMTETIGPPLMNPLFGARRHTAVGRTALGYTCRVIREDGSPAGVGEPGELLVHGSPGVSLMAGYLDNPEATAEALRDGWLHTGDVMRLEEDGLLSFVGRTKDMIKRAGENVAAGEVESVLMEHPAVADAAVVGVPDPMRDEAIVAFVVLADGAAVADGELPAWCEERLSRFRVPSVIEAVDALPRTAVGKIQKHILRDGWLSRNAPTAQRAAPE